MLLLALHEQTGESYVDECQTCREAKVANYTLRPMGKEILVKIPFQRFFMDFLGPDPRSESRNCFIFIILDHLTKFVILEAMPKASSRSVIRFLITEI